MEFTNAGRVVRVGIEWHDVFVGRAYQWTPIKFGMTQCGLATVLGVDASDECLQSTRAGFVFGFVGIVNVAGRRRVRSNVSLTRIRVRLKLSLMEKNV